MVRSPVNFMIILDCNHIIAFDLNIYPSYTLNAYNELINSKADYACGDCRKKKNPKPRKIIKVFPDWSILEKCIGENIKLGIESFYEKEKNGGEGFEENFAF